MDVGSATASGTGWSVPAGTRCGPAEAPIARATGFVGSTVAPAAALPADADAEWLHAAVPLGGPDRLRRHTSRGVAALARLAAVDLVSGEAPLDLAVLRTDAPDGPVPVSRPEGTHGPVAPPPVDRPALPPGRDMFPAASGRHPGSPASRLLEALARFERRILGLVTDASPMLREQARIAEARRLALIHFHRLLVRELVGGLAQPEVVADALAAGLPAYTALATRVGQRVPPVATECLIVLETLAAVLGADDPETPALPLGAVLLASTSMGVPASTAAQRHARLVGLLLDGGGRGVPSGQGLAAAFGLDALPPAAIASRWPASVRARTDVLALARATPLPLYLLLEAELDGDGRLGALGSRVLAEGLLGPIRSRFPERAIDPRGRLEPAGLRERDGRAVIGLVDVLRFIGAAGIAD